MFSTLIDTIKQATELKLDVNQFSTALKRVSVLSAKDKNPSVTLDITKKEMEISSFNEAMNTRAEEVMDVSFTEKKLVGFNYKYLIEILSVFNESPKLYLDSRNFLFIKHKKKTGILSPIMVNEKA